MADKVYPETPSLVSPEKKLESSESTVESTLKLVLLELNLIKCELTETKAEQAILKAQLEGTEARLMAELDQIHLKHIQQQQSTQPEPEPAVPLLESAGSDSWNPIAEELVEFRSKNYQSNLFHIKRIFSSHSAYLSPLTLSCPKIQIVLGYVLTNSSNMPQSSMSVSSGSEATRLRNLTDDEATILGKSFRRHLLANKEFEGAVEAYRLDNPVLQPAFDNFPALRPILVAISKRLLAASLGGLAKRVALGAFLSIGDLVSDTTVIISYFEEGRTGQAYALISMVTMSLFCQIILVLAQNSKKSRSEILRELFFVVTFLKPAVDAYRVSTGYEDGQLNFSPLQEMGVSKGAELAAESIPGNVLQIYVFITNPTRSTLHLVSILISTMTTAFNSAVMSFDMDASPEQRRKIPDFYGYLGDTNFERTTTFLVMFLLAGLHNLSKSIGVALLLAVSGQTTLVVLAGEMITYHLAKLIRRDYTTFAPGLEGGLKITCAFFCHVITKTIVDFTGMIHMRGPKLVGGLMFLALTIEAQVLPFVAFEIYKRSDDVENKLDLEELETALRALLGAWAINMLLFVMLIKQKYRKTFWDPQTGWQMVIATFENSNDAYLKLNAIFTNHISMSRRIKGNVIEYMAENWAEWERAKPSWFTTGFISKIPDEFIPRRALRALNHASVGGVREKRNSMNLREFVRNSLEFGEEVADAAAGAISAKEREEGQRKLSMALRAGRGNREEE